MDQDLEKLGVLLGHRRKLFAQDWNLQEITYVISWRLPLVFCRARVRNCAHATALRDRQLPEIQRIGLVAQ
jgi:hypothetical protein